MVAPILLTMLMGSQIADLIPTIAQLRIESFKGYPYFYHGSQKTEFAYLEAYKNNHHALAVYTSAPTQQAMFIGVPLLTIFPTMKQLFESAHYIPDECYYCEEVVLPVNNPPLVFEMFEAIEKKVSQLGYKNICFITIKDEENSSLKQDSYQDIEPLFEQLGFSKTNLSMVVSYPTYCEDGSVQERNHEFIFWIKNLN